MLELQPCSDWNATLGSVLVRLLEEGSHSQATMSRKKQLMASIATEIVM